jgi:hypothetical protein
MSKKAGFQSSVDYIDDWKQTNDEVIIFRKKNIQVDININRNDTRNPTQLISAQYISYSIRFTSK